jgi:RND superfamily putative drug exporter
VSKSGLYTRALIAARWPVVLGWIAAAVAAWAFLPVLGAGSAPVDDIVPADASAVATQIRAAELFGVPSSSDVMVVQRRAAGLTSDDVSAHARAAGAAAKVGGTELRGALPLVNQSIPGVRWRETRTTALDMLFVDPSVSLQGRTDIARSYASALRLAPGSSVGITGAGPARLAQFEQIEDVLPWVTAATIAVILLMTTLYFRSPGAPLVTLASAGIAYVVAVRGAAWLSERAGVDVPREIEPVLVVLLLGLTTDYCVFFMADARRRMLAGATRLDAARGAVGRIGPTVLTAGTIVAACSAALLAGRLDFFRVFGPGLAFCALVVTIVALTLVPAVLAIAGPRLFGRRVREAEGTARGRTVEDLPTGGSIAMESVRRSRWRRRMAGTLGAVRAARREAGEAGEGGRVATGARLAPRVLAARPVALVLAVACIAGLLWAAAQAREIQLGVDTVRALPADDPVHRAGADAERGFAGGILAPTEIVLEAPGIGADDAALERLRASITRSRGVVGAVGAQAGDAIASVTGAPDPMTSRDRNAARIVVVVGHDATSARGLADFRRLRDAMPRLVRDAGLPAGTRVAYGGEAPLGAETVDAVKDDLVRVGIAIAIVTFALLVLFLRALVAPLLLLAAGALGYLASLGLTSLVVREVSGDDELTFFVPLVGGVLLVALGSDYNVLVAGRVRAESARRRAREAIAVAVPQASRAITVAGMTLAGTFALLALVPIRPFRELALLLALGVLVDALVVRSVLIPSLLSLAGDGAWWPSRGRREQPLEAVLGRVCERTGLPRAAALDATAATLRTLGERIGDAQATELAVHLPPSLGEALEDPEGCEPFDAEAFVQRVAVRREVDAPRAREEASAVLHTLRDLLPETEMDYVRAALSEDYRSLVDGTGAQAGDGLVAPGPGRTSTS